MASKTDASSPTRRRNGPSASPIPPLEVTNLRLSHTAKPLGIDDPTPSISWSYSIPSSSHSWWQQTYIISLKSWNPNHGFQAMHATNIVGPNTQRSNNITWPKAFPQVKSGWIYELDVVVVMTQHPKKEDLKFSQAGEDWEFGNADGSKRYKTNLGSVELALEVVERLELGAYTAVVIQSDVLHFEGGLMGGLKAWSDRAPDIAPISTGWDLKGWDKPKPPLVFKNSITLESSPVMARLYVTAFGVYRVFIDGKAIGDSIMEPGWTEYTHRLLYQTYDITENLKDGPNEIVVFVADGWYRGRLASGWEARRGIFGRQTGFMALIQTYGLAGHEHTFWTGETEETGWTCTKTSPILGTGIYDGECYDSRVSLAEVQDAEWRDVRVMHQAFMAGKPILQASTAPPVRCTEILKVKDVITSPTGKTVLDFGQNTAGRIRLKGSAPSGTSVSFVHVELLEPDGTPCTSLLREAKATDTYIFSGDGVEEWEPEFTFHGFRYVQVDPWIDGLEVIVKVYGSDLKQGIVKFESSHSELNRLVENIRWSARANFFAVCTDCPQRDERMGWTGDINAFGPTAVYIFDCQTFLASWLQGLTDGQMIGGNNCPPVVSPNCLHPPGSHRPTALWQDVLVTLPWYLYQTYGDPTLLSSLYQSMVLYHTHGIPKDPATGLWAPGFQYGDWLDPTAPPGRPDLPATNPMYVADSWLCNITVTLIRIAKVLGKHDDAEAWTGKAHQLITQWRAKYITPIEKYERARARGSKRNQLLRQDTQTAYALALNFHLLPSHLIKPAVDRLHQLLEKSNYHLCTGFAGTPELLHAICAHVPTNLAPINPSVGVETSFREGRQRRIESHETASLSAISLAYKVLLKPRDPPGWLYPITMGATSIWERWDAVKPDGTVNTAGMTSLNHYAYGSVGKWIFEHVGGIRLTPYTESGGVGLGGSEVGKVIFDPIPNLEFGVVKGEMAYEAFAGRAECIWSYDKDSKRITIEVAVPGNCEGEVRALGKVVKRAGAGRWVVKVGLEEESWRLLESLDIGATQHRGLEEEGEKVLVQDMEKVRLESKPSIVEKVILVDTRRDEEKKDKFAVEGVVSEPVPGALDDLTSERVESTKSEKHKRQGSADDEWVVL
ncbi:hypothetical protein ABW19_dt0208782 [Dactylella cylindrospora]|nr:hypothetical protein ABW19_dt0208782 [Dactylella cylindrospora]